MSKSIVSSHLRMSFKLNPYKREIHCYIDGEGENRKTFIICGYEVYIKRAERTGNLDGWSVSVEGVGNEMKAVVEIHRKDWSNPFRHEVFFSEAAQKTDDGALTSFWKKMPRFQLKENGDKPGIPVGFLRRTRRSAV